jgi:hypothetical protein
VERFYRASTDPFLSKTIQSKGGIMAFLPLIGAIVAAAIGSAAMAEQEAARQRREAEGVAQRARAAAEAQIAAQAAQQKAAQEAARAAQQAQIEQEAARARAAAAAAAQAREAEIQRERTQLGHVEAVMNGCRTGNLNEVPHQLTQMDLAHFRSLGQIPLAAARDENTLEQIGQMLAAERTRRGIA